MAVKQKLVFTTTDGAEFTQKEKAIFHERGLIIKRILGKDKNLKNTVDKNDLHVLINQHFDTFVTELHAESHLPQGYGMREDF